MAVHSSTNEAILKRFWPHFCSWRHPCVCHRLTTSKFLTVVQFESTKHKVRLIVITVMYVVFFLTVTFLIYDFQIS